MYTVAEVAAILNVSTKTVRRLVQRELLPRSKAIRHIRIPREAVDAFIQATAN